MGFLSEESTEHSSERICPDRTEVEQCLLGDRESFRVLLLKYQDPIYRIVLRQVRDDGLARELTQDTFLRVHRGLSKFRYDATFKTWVIRIAMNCVRSYYSSKRFRDSRNTTSFEETTAGEVFQSDTLDVEAMGHLRESICRLSEELREVIVLCGVEQYTYEEAASVLEIPVGTVRSRLHRARLRLREDYFGMEDKQDG